MTTEPPSERLRAVGTGTLRVTIDVEAEREPINGRVAAVDGDGRQFTGWLELMSALQDILHAPGDRGAEFTGARRCLH